MGIRNIQEISAADKKGLLLDLLLERHRTMKKELGRVGATFRVNMLGQTQFFTADPKNIQALLATQFDDFYLGPARRGNMLPTLGDGIFVQDGEAWSHSRALLRPNFVRDQVGDLELEESHIQNLLKVLPVQADGWTAETNVQQLFFRLTLDSACEFLFGESVDSQLAEAGLRTNHTGKGKDERAFSLNFDSAQRWLAQRFRVGNFYWMVTGAEFRENNRVVNDFISHYVDLALQESSSEKKSPPAGKERYVFLEALAQQTRDPVELRAQLLNILLAGRDTTASLLSWLFHLLVRHPAVFTKLRATILDTFGTYENPTDITFASLKSCQYLQHTINEVLRLYAVVPLNARRSKHATTLPGGGGPDGSAPVYIPAGVDVGYSVHVMHHRTDLWGEDADEFRPERFIDRRPGWEFLPFNGKSSSSFTPFPEPKSPKELKPKTDNFSLRTRWSPRLHRS
nr:cytochrome p450 52a13 [Quercus suber]